MAELDDFFAKKDKSKKKSKTKSKIIPSDLLAQQESSEQNPAAKKEKKRKDKNEQMQSDTTASKEDEEWVDYEHEEQKDYSGLRIQTLQIVKSAEEEQEDLENENHELDENGDRKDKSGPWNVKDVQPSQPSPEPEPEPPKPVVEEAPKIAGKYIPPSMRGQASQSSSTLAPLRLGQRRKKVAPDINDSDAFPTLGGAAPPPTWPRGDTSSKDTSFERVKSGASNKQQDDSSRIELGNRYQSLES